MRKLWFLLHQNVVNGPLNSPELEDHLSQMGDVQKAAIWWRGQAEWMNADTWKKNLPSILQSFEMSPDKKAYYLDYMGEKLGPLSVKEIALRLKTVKSLDDVRLWSNDDRHWQSVYEVGALCDILGLTKRSHSRVPMIGSCVVQKDSLKGIADVTSISIGGLGILFNEKPILSGVISLELRSPSLFNSIKTRAEVAYAKENGNYGLKFLNLSQENQAALLEYIKSFEAARVAA